MPKKMFKPIFLLIMLVILSFISLAYVFLTKQNSKDILYIDVAAKKGVQILASKTINSIDFHDMNTYQEFNLTFFTSTDQDGIEFRIKCLRDREVNLILDNIKLYDLKDQKVIFWESAADKPQKGPSWHVTEDREALDDKVVQMDSRVKTESWLYGPYLHDDSYGESLANRKLRATFRMKITDVLLPIYVAELSVVVNENKGPTDCLAYSLIDLAEVNEENDYNMFNLTFTVPATVNRGVEFRIKNRNNGYCTLLVDGINVYKSDFGELVYSECSIDKLVLGEGWIVTTDLEASCPKVMFISSTQSNDQILCGPQIITDAYGDSMFGETYVVSFRIRIIEV